VVRVIARDCDGYSYGSGALVAVWGEQGLVLTNWHVVREARGPLLVVFADGFSTRATVMASDRVWDLAALAVWRPKAKPIRLSTEAPRPGDLLTIAGYGPGWYRAATGRCTQYVSPGRNQPFEMLEMSAPARQGDSGGPILNRRGELAGILFGTASGTTTGSYCGRVRRFLDSVTGDFDRLAESSTLLAQGPSALSGSGQAPPKPSVAGEDRSRRLPTAAIAARPPESDPRADSRLERPPPRPGPDQQLASGPAAGRETNLFPSPTDRSANPSRPAAATGFDRLKNVLAGIGLIAILFHGLRLLGSLQRV
jgi:hypothetical protein